VRKNEFQVRINWGDTDKAGIVWYPNYFKWFDMAGHQFFRSIGLSPLKLEEEKNIILPLLDAGCTFEKPLYYDNIITIRTTIDEINRKTIRLKHEVFRGDTRSGYGYEIRGWVKKVDGKISAVLIPEEVKDILKKDQTEENKQTNPWLTV
jgi:acyl-CoA thioester hydrolase